jgi:hypothetical protein
MLVGWPRLISAARIALRGSVMRKPDDFSFVVARSSAVGVFFPVLPLPVRG